MQLIDAPSVVLTERQIRVLHLAAEGLTNEQIAHQMYLAPKTVGAVVSEAMRQLGARNRVHAVAIAMRSGIV